VFLREQAWKLIEQNNWEPYSQATEVPDEKRCLQRILQHQFRVEGEKTVTRTVSELVDIALHHANDINVSVELAEATLGRNGIKAESGLLYVSNTANAVAAILGDTPWGSCWPTVLARLPGAGRPGVTRFRGMAGTSRAVSVPVASI
jgi:hypothetical protein